MQRRGDYGQTSVPASAWPIATLLEQRPDAELIESTKAGNAMAFAVLYDRYSARVYRHVYYRLGRVPESEDLTQQTFLQAWSAMPRYRLSDVPFVAWLIKIAHNLVVSYFRVEKRTAELQPELPASDGSTDPEQYLQQRHRSERVRQAIRHLDADYQMVVTMRYLDEIDYKSIAQSLGKTEGAVRIMLHRGLRKLRRYVEDV